jgi:hypothetical protein
LREVDHLSPIQPTKQFGIAVLVVFELYVVAQERTAGWLIIDKHPLGFKDGLMQLAIEGGR